MLSDDGKYRRFKDSSAEGFEFIWRFYAETKKKISIS